ncbi:radical SAM protein [Candidatus Poribacteria bacterium]
MGKLELESRDAHSSYESQEVSRNVYFYAPTIKRYETDEYVNKRYPFFVPVSITGKKCRLNCDHCRGKILESMHEAHDPESLYSLALRLKERGCRGILVSGGAGIDGSVPLTGFAPVMARIKHELGFKMAVHTGLVDEEMADALSEACVDSAMVDVIGSDETIRSVYHLKASVSDYENSLKYLAERDVRVSPHVVVGLHYGEILGEYDALEIISRYDIASLVLVVLTPMCNTPMVEVIPPGVEEMKGILTIAREMFPSTPILLGCARPAGKYRLELDKAALDIGINGIAYPAEGVVTYATEKGLTPVFSEYCCSFIFDQEL